MIRPGQGPELLAHAENAADGKTPALKKYGHLIAIGLLLLALIFYLYRLDKWFLDDDEGGFCYAAWRISAGEVPYRDLMTEQVPLFLYFGATLVRFFGPSVLPLRYATVLVTLLAAWFMYLSARAVFGCRTALLSLPLFLLHKDVYLIARFFRPEAYMLLLIAVATYAFLVWYQQRRRWGALLAGVLFGLATLFKLFAVLPAAGCGLFLLYQWYRSRERRLFSGLLALAAGLGVTVGAVFVAFQIKYPVFLSALFRLHLMQGAELSHWQVLVKGLGFFRDYFMGNPAFLLLALLGAASTAVMRVDIRTFYAWQIPTAAAFLILSRSLQDRHLVYLTPALCVLAALSLERILAGNPLSLVVRKGGDQIGDRTRRWFWSVLGVGIVMFTLWPSWRADMDVAAWQDLDTRYLVQYVQAYTAADDIVLCDDAGLNFYAQRKSTYLGADLSSVTTSTGQITGAALIGELNATHAKMVLINAAGGSHHLVNLPDYADLYKYIQSHFHLVGRVNRSYQTIEIYDQEELMPLLPGVNFGGKLGLTGADLRTATVRAGQALKVTLRWQALDKMERDYTLSLRLVDAQGHRYGQQDILLQRTFTSGWEGSREIIEQVPTTRWSSGDVMLGDVSVLVFQGTPPGEYRLMALLYDLSSGEGLPVQGRDGVTLGQEYDLGSIEVDRPEQEASVDELPIQWRVTQDFGGQVQLLGLGPLAESIRPGDVLHLALFWQAQHLLESDWQLLVRIQGPDGERVAQSQFELANPNHPTRQWVKGEVVLGQYDLLLDRSASPGEAQIVVDLVDTTTGRRLLEHDLVLSSLQIEGGARRFDVPDDIQHPLTANLDNRVRLLGYDLAESSVRAGGVLHLALYWQALAEMDTSYTVFTHLLDAQGKTWGQLDSVPVQGARPTTSWLRGEVIVDAYAIQVVPETPSGECVLEVGFYNAASGERLAVLDLDGRALDTRVRLPPVYITP